jgi:hypothetical protein
LDASGILYYNGEKTHYYGFYTNITVVPIDSPTNILKTWDEVMDEWKKLHGEMSESGGGTATVVQTVNTINTGTGIIISATQGVVQHTSVGANFIYSISGNKVLINSVANGFKYAPYVGLGVTTVAGIYLSTQTDPSTNLPYQSWAETGIDIGANLGAIYLGTQYGGWVGAVAATIYVADKAAIKAYMNTIREHPDWVLPPSVYSFSH